MRIVFLVGSSVIRFLIMLTLLGMQQSKPVPVIVVISSNDGVHYQLTAINPATSTRTRITNDARTYWYPACSPDGTIIALTVYTDNTSDLYLLDLNNGQLTQITHGLIISYPAWSADGKRLAFTVHDDIYTVNTDGSNLTNLTRTPSIDNRPSWSPDGKRIVFSTNRDFNDPQALVYELYIMNADGSHPSRLTHVYDLPKQHSTDVVSATFPAWSPDGQRIVFSILGSTYSGLYTIDPTGQQLSKLPVDGFSWMTHWLPDKRTIVASVNDGQPRPGDTSPTSTIHLIDMQNFTSRKVSDSGFEDIYPSWCVLNEYQF